MRLVFFGSGEFGLPTLERLVEHHDVRAAVAQPDRPAGRRRRPTPPPVAAFARERDLLLRQPENVNDPATIESIRALDPDAFVVIAYGQKLGEPLLRDVFAINLHASLLPKYRGAAPINRAILEGETETGVSVITLATRMDAGDILGRSTIPIGPAETAGELHDRLAALGPDLVERVLAEASRGELRPVPQDESLATRAPKLSRADAAIDVARPADEVRRRINGLSPWPGVQVELEGTSLKLLRAGPANAPASTVPGAIDPEGILACGEGAIRLLEVQPAGKRPMTFADFVRGHPLPPGARLQPNGDEGGSR